MKERELWVLLDGSLIGRVTRDARQRLCFTYEAAWRNDPDATPLSLSMPLTKEAHGHAAIEAFMWGLLPDNAQVLERWARRFQVSANNV